MRPATGIFSPASPESELAVAGVVGKLIDGQFGLRPQRHARAVSHDERESAIGRGDQHVIQLQVHSFSCRERLGTSPNRAIPLNGLDASDGKFVCRAGHGCGSNPEQSYTNDNFDHR